MGPLMPALFSGWYFHVCEPGVQKTGWCTYSETSLLTRLLFNCAKTVSEPDLLKRPRLLLERKKIPQIIVIVRIQRKTTEPLEATRLPWAQGVGRSNRPAPTN